MSTPFDPNDPPEPVASVFGFGHAAEDPNDRPEDCGCPLCEEMLADLERRGAAVLAGWRSPDDSDLERVDPFP